MTRRAKSSIALGLSVAFIIIISREFFECNADRLFDWYINRTAKINYASEMLNSIHLCELCVLCGENCMTKVKICGITNLEDALLSAKFGADALGFNFYEKSPRYILPEKAAEICRELPAKILKVGVFVNESKDKILEIARQVPLDAVQLHGDESPEFVRTLKENFSGEIIKALRVSENFQPEDVLKFEADAILLDAYSKNEYGGTGESFNWEIAKRVQEIFPKMYLAGGLSQDNIADATIKVKPFAVDACSCLEIEKGKKDKTKIINFICNFEYINKQLFMKKDSLLNDLRAFRAKSIMYFPEKSLTQICSYLFGYYSGVGMTSDFNSKANLFRQFDNWLGLKRSSYTQGIFTYAWYFLEKCGGNEEKAFDLFYANLEEFLLEKDLNNE